MEEQNESLYQLIVSFIEAGNKNEIFERIFVKFEPLLVKYAVKLEDIDMKYYLAEALYVALLKIPLSLERFKEDKFILSYIRNSVYHEFLKIRKEYGSEADASLDDEVYSNTIASKDDEFSQFWSDTHLKEIKQILSKQEFEIFLLIFMGYSETEIAKINSVTRQAICKRLKNIRNKIIKGSFSFN